MNAISDSPVFHLWADSARVITTVCHSRPDGDAAGASMALVHWLRTSLGKDAAAILPGPVPETLSFLLEGEPVITASADLSAATQRLARTDLLVCLDFNTLSRAEELEEVLRAFQGRKVLIDHHKDPVREEFDLCFSCTEVSSACELLYELLLSMPGIDGDAARLPAESARALMAGMTTDTNNFANSVFPGTLRMASALLAAGVDREDIIDRLYRSERPNRLAAQGEMLSRLMKLGHGYAVTVLDKDFLERHSLLEGETEGFVNLPLTLKDVRLSVFAKAGDGCFRVSVRSKKGVSARILARDHFHGGGHEQAAGGRIFIPGDVPSPEAVASYIETITARFMQQPDTAF